MSQTSCVTTTSGWLVGQEADALADGNKDFVEIQKLVHLIIL